MRIVRVAVCIIVAALMIVLIVYLFRGESPDAETVAVEGPMATTPPRDWSGSGFQRQRQRSRPGPWSGVLNRLFTPPSYGLPDVIAALEALNLQPDFELSIEQKQKIQDARKAATGASDQHAAIDKIKAVLTLEQNQKLQQYLTLNPRVPQTHTVARPSTRPATRPARH